MNYYVSDEVPNGWNHIISSFIQSAEHGQKFGHTPEIDEVEFLRKNGNLFINYQGGDEVVDAFALFARILASKTCTDCGLPSTRQVFDSPKCDNCY